MKFLFLAIIFIIFNEHTESSAIKSARKRLSGTSTEDKHPIIEEFPDIQYPQSVLDLPCYYVSNGVLEAFTEDVKSNFKSMKQQTKKPIEELVIINDNHNVNTNTNTYTNKNHDSENKEILDKVENNFEQIQQDQDQHDELNSTTPVVNTDITDTQFDITDTKLNADDTIIFNFDELNSTNPLVNTYSANTLLNTEKVDDFDGLNSTYPIEQTNSTSEKLYAENTVIDNQDELHSTTPQVGNNSTNTDCANEEAPTEIDDVLVADDLTKRKKRSLHNSGEEDNNNDESDVETDDIPPAHTKASTVGTFSSSEAVLPKPPLTADYDDGIKIEDEEDSVVAQHCEENCVVEKNHTEETMDL